MDFLVPLMLSGMMVMYVANVVVLYIYIQIIIYLQINNMYE